MYGKQVNGYRWWIFSSCMFFFLLLFTVWLFCVLLCSFIYFTGRELKSGTGLGHKKLKKCLPVFGKCFVYKYKGGKTIFRSKSWEQHTKKKMDEKRRKWDREAERMRTGEPSEMNQRTNERTIERWKPETAILNVEFNSAPSQLMVTNELLLVENDAEKQKVIRLIGFGVCKDAHTTPTQREHERNWMNVCMCMSVFVSLCAVSFVRHHRWIRVFFFLCLFCFRCVVARRVNLFSSGAFSSHLVFVYISSFSQSSCSIYQDEKLR